MGRVGELAAGLLCVCVLLDGVGVAYGASPVFVDSAGLCAGLTPCFTTVQAGVNNAGPPPAEVAIFPGVYAENVNLSLMGSAIAGTPGTITLRTVNASGTPTPGTARITPASGVPIFNSASPFPGGITIEGLVVQSPDSDGISVGTLQGSLIVRDVRSDGNGRGGLQASQGNNDVSIARSSFSNNLMGNGISFGVAQDVSFDHVTADGNNGEGASFGLAGRVTATDSSFSNNTDGDGLSFAVATEVTFTRVVASGNSGDGASFGTSGAVRITESTFNNNQDSDGLSFAVATSVTLEHVVANGNASDGASFGTNGAVAITDSVFNENVSNDGLSFSVATSVHLERVVANMNGMSGASFGTSGSVEVIDSTFNRSVGGSGMTFSVATSVSLTSVVTEGNAQNGAQVGTQSLRVTGSRFAGNGTNGLFLSVSAPAGEFRIRCSDFTGNGTGLRLTGVSVTVDARQNFWGAASGPTHPNNPNGTGDTIVDGANGGSGMVEFAPFLTTSAVDSGVCHPNAPALGTPALFALVLALLVLPILHLRRRQSA